MKYLYLIILSTLIIYSCKNPNAIVEALEVEVIAIHDEVMPETATIQNLKRQLEKTEILSKDSLTIRSIIKDLNAADDAMMDWMEKYKMIDLKKDTAFNMEYLRDQKLKIINVKEKMISSINKSKEYLAKR